jgi:hypothetical protein
MNKSGDIKVVRAVRAGRATNRCRPPGGADFSVGRIQAIEFGVTASNDRRLWKAED